MGARQVKKYRKVAEKAAKTQAFFLAQNQILEIMNSPFMFRLKFCWKIMFPKKDRLKQAASNGEVIRAAHGISLAEKAIAG